MNDEIRDKLREAARRRGNCQKCNNGSLEIRDGSEVGGLPGIKYKQCGACGWTQAATKRRPKFKF